MSSLDGETHSLPEARRLLLEQVQQRVRARLSIADLPWEKLRRSTMAMPNLIAAWTVARQKFYQHTKVRATQQKSNVETK